MVSVFQELRCCGRAYVVFHTQVSMIRVLRERRGLRKQILFPQYKSEEGEIDMAQLLQRGDQPDGVSQLAAVKSCQVMPSHALGMCLRI